MAEASGRIKHINSDEDFEKELRQTGDKLVVVEFFSEEYVLFYAAYSWGPLRPAEWTTENANPYSSAIGQSRLA